MEVCEYWNECENNYITYEYCKLIKQPCFCCGEKEQCDYKWSLYEAKDKSNESM